MQQLLGSAIFERTNYHFIRTCRQKTVGIIAVYTITYYISYSAYTQSIEFASRKGTKGNKHCRSSDFMQYKTKQKIMSTMCRVHAHTKKEIKRNEMKLRIAVLAPSVPLYFFSKIMSSSTVKY